MTRGQSAYIEYSKPARVDCTHFARFHSNVANSNQAAVHAKLDTVRVLQYVLKNISFVAIYFSDFWYFKKC